MRARGRASPAAAAVGGYRSRQGDVGVSGSHGAFDYAASLAAEKSRRRLGDPARRSHSAPSIPTTTASRASREPAPRLHARARDTASASASSRSRLNAQYDSRRVRRPDFNRRSFARLPQPPEDPSVAALDYRGAVISSLWTTSAAGVGHSVDDSTSGGTTTSRFKTEREQATWQNALVLAADQQLVLAYEYLHEDAPAAMPSPTAPKRHNNAARRRLLGPLRRARRPGRACATTTTRPTAATPPAGSALSFEADARPEACGALAGTTFRAPTFNDLFFPGLRHSSRHPGSRSSPSAAAASRSARAGSRATRARRSRPIATEVKDLIG